MSKEISPTPKPKDLADRLEIFVREQAGKFGEVISYVPTKKAKAQEVEPIRVTIETEVTIEIEPTAPTATTAPVSDTRFTMLEAKLLPFAGEAWTSAASLDVFQEAIHDCTKCDLAATRTKLVFGKGAPNARVMVIGEAPGADEDESGEPFIGRAGQLLTKMLEAIQFKREDVYITNILKSRPPNNRDPKPEEVEACEPYLWKQILLIQPEFILCFGRVAGSNLLKLPAASLASMRGKVYDYSGIRVMVTYHPAALMRNPDWKKGAWEDLQKFREMYDSTPTNAI